MVGDFHTFQGQEEERRALEFAKRQTVKQLTMTHRRGWVGHTLGKFPLFFARPRRILVQFFLSCFEK